MTRKTTPTAASTAIAAYQSRPHQRHSTGRTTPATQLVEGRYPAFATCQPSIPWESPSALPRRRTTNSKAEAKSPTGLEAAAPGREMLPDRLNLRWNLRKERVDISENSIKMISLMMLHSIIWAYHQNSPEFEVAFWLEEAKNLAREGGLDFVWKAK